MDNNSNDKYLTLPEEAKPLVEDLRKLWNFSEKEMKGKTFQTKNDLRLIILLQITTAASRIFHSALAQIDGNSFYGLDFLLRPLVEATINYKYIKEDDTQMRARAFIADDINIRLKEVRRLIPLDNQSPLPSINKPEDIKRYRKLESNLLQEKQELENKYGKKNLNFLKIAERASKSGTSGAYATSYWLLCQDTHLTVRGLDRFTKIDNDQLSVTFDLELDRFIIALKTLYIVFAALLNDCSEQFGIPNKVNLNKLTSGKI